MIIPVGEVLNVEALVHDFDILIRYQGYSDTQRGAGACFFGFEKFCNEGFVFCFVGTGDPELQWLLETREEVRRSLIKYVIILVNERAERAQPIEPGLAARSARSIG